MHQHGLEKSVMNRNDQRTGSTENCRTCRALKPVAQVSGALDTAWPKTCTVLLLAQPVCCFEATDSSAS